MFFFLSVFNIESIFFSSFTSFYEFSNMTSTLHSKSTLARSSADNSQLTLVQSSAELSVSSENQRSSLIPLQPSPISNLSTGIPISFGAITTHKASIPNDYGEDKCGLAITVLDKDSEYAARITYVVNIQAYDYTKTSSRFASRDSENYYCADEDDDTSNSGTTIQTGYITRNQLIQQSVLSGSSNGNEGSFEQHGQVNIVVDNTIALRFAEQETTAVKNRIILIALTLTIPLFLYLRFTIWKQ